MVKFGEDMIFKNVVDEDAVLFLDILGRKSKMVKIITQELIQKDPKTFRPDVILELDDEILIVELQSTPVGVKHHQRFLVYLAIATYNNKNNKQVNLCVFTTAEDSRKAEFTVNDDNVFRYDIVSLSCYDSGKIINTINYKKENNEAITSKELILYALVPLIEKYGDVEDYIDEVVHTLIELKDFDESIKSLAYGIEWLIVDKFVRDKTERKVLCDLLGDKMSLIDEYGENKKRQGEDGIIINQLKSGLSPVFIAESSKIPLSRVNDIKREYGL